MRKIVKPVLCVALVLLFLNIGVSYWILARSLKSRFPHLNFKKARLGVASWYSRTDKNINEQTANGEKFNDRAKTCASWDYPFGTRLLVINPLNGKWVVCRVNDRGPAKHLNREVDMTKTAFKKIANPKWGLIHVAFLPVPKE